MLVTVYQSLSAPPETAPRLQVMRLGAETHAPAAMAGQAAPAAVRSEDADVVAHVQLTGDAAGTLGDWVGTRGSQKWIQGFSLAPQRALKPATSNIRRCWDAAGCRHGSRAASSAAAAGWRCLAGPQDPPEGQRGEDVRMQLLRHLVDGSSVGPIPGGEICEAESLAALEAFQVTIHRRGGRPRHADTQAGDQAGGQTGTGETLPPALRRRRASGPAEHGRPPRFRCQPRAAA